MQQRNQQTNVGTLFPQSDKHPVAKNKSPNSKCGAYLLSLGPSPFSLCLFSRDGQSPPTLHCYEARHVWRLSCLHSNLTKFQLIYGSGAGHGQTDKRKKERKKEEGTNEETVWMNRPWSLVSLPSCQSACWAAALWCVDHPATPSVITLYDLLHSKCYINLVTPPDNIPLFSPHTHTHTSYHANIVIPARNFLPLLAVTSDLMVLWWLHSKMLHGVR